MFRFAVVVPILAALGCANAVAADAARGKLLYDSRCDNCHSTSVHQRAARKAQDYRGIREEVLRWNRELGGAWASEEIDDVTLYLNGRYYLFRCPASVCGTSRSLNSAPGSDALVARRL